MIKIILVGLGNDGPKYNFTRHNIGQAWLDYMVEKDGLTWKEEPYGFSALFQTTVYQLLLVKTKGYINESGQFLKKMLANSPYQNWPIIFTFDNSDLAFGKVKINQSLKNNGHKGNANLIQHFYSNQFLVFYWGIGKSPNLKDWVLSPFPTKERAFLKTTLFPAITWRFFQNWKWWNSASGLIRHFFQTTSKKEVTKPHLAILGGQWGDEGKGKVVDYFVQQDYDLIARFSGGDNAGHTVVVDKETFQFSILPVAAIQPAKVSLLGRNCLINLEQLVKEITILKTRQVAINLKIDGQAQIIMPYHLLLDQLQEKKLADAQIGTTKRGIGPCWEDKVARRGLQIDDLFHPTYFETRLKRVLAEKNLLLAPHQLTLDYQIVKKQTYQLFNQIKEYVTDLRTYYQPDKHQKILFEGAQGTLLDINFGAFPFVTSSGTTSAHIGACFGDLMKATKFLGVFKAYSTRVGTGILPTEASTTFSIQNHLVKKGHEYGVVTKRKRRTGWFDAVLARYACQVNGFDEVALTLLDVLSGLEEVKICTGYQVGTKTYQEWTPSLQYQSEIQCHYLTLPGWKEDLTTCKSYFQLPPAVQHYIATIEKILKIPITFLSVGKKRKQTILTQGQVK